jgi:competence protein ComEC
VLLREPEAFFGASFQLSFGATAVLLAFLPWIRKLNTLKHKFVRWMAEAGAVSLAVHVGMWPLLVYYFHQISLAGVVANWTVFPLSGGVMVLGLLVGIWGVCCPQSVPAMMTTGMHHVLQGTLSLISVMSGWRWAALALPAPSWKLCSFYYAVLICILVKVNRNQNEFKK